MFAIVLINLNIEEHFEDLKLKKKNFFNYF